MSERLHWFCCCFEWVQNGIPTKGTSYIARYDKDVTMAAIDEARDIASISEDAPLTSCSYLGCMTNEKFTGKTDNLDVS